MANQFEANVLDSELHFYSYRKLFEADVPTGAQIVAALHERFEQGGLATIEYDARKIYIQEFDLYDRYAVMLFHATDPNVRDMDYSNIETGDLRTAERAPDEEPAFSAHVVICTDRSYDNRRSYPFIIEEAKALPRTIVAKTINTYLAPIFNCMRSRPQKGDKKEFRVVARLQAPLDETVEGVLASGGRLEALKLRHESFESVVHGDEAYPVHEDRLMRIRVDGQPMGERARDLLKSYYSGLDRGQYKSLKIVLFDPESNANKTIPVDLSSDDILHNAFIRKRVLKGFKEPLKECDPNLRADLTQKMREIGDVEEN